MPGERDKKQEANVQDPEELGAEELESVAGGAAYLKFDGVDGESRKKVSKVDAITIKQT